MATVRPARPGQLGSPSEASAPAAVTRARAVVDRMPDRAMTQEATAGVAPKRRICW
ncbi:hypothetical protein [Actinoplanes sp. NPDC051851]|uniref:hypothetical protein n=1 Tax=Actinoplanes sp. NPDC051851 TaxID=3154753 RepID=UPI0034460A74